LFKVIAQLADLVIKSYNKTTSSSVKFLKLERLETGEKL
jgi:hypothetical protein